MTSPSRVTIDTCCDAVEQVVEIDVESADESPRQLLAMRILPLPSGGEWQVVAVRGNADAPAPSDAGRTDDDRPILVRVETLKANVASPSLDLEALRTALIATMHETALTGALPRGSSFGGGPRLWRALSVRGFHIASGAGTSRPSVTPESIDRWYGGFRSSEGQAELLPLDLALEPVREMSRTLRFDATVEPSHRDLFVERFARFAMADDWLRELYLAMAEHLGKPGLVPTLVDVAVRGPARQRVLAVNAIAAITRWDRRRDERGNARPVDEVASEYAAECQR